MDMIFSHEPFKTGSQVQSEEIRDLKHEKDLMQC